MLLQRKQTPPRTRLGMEAILEHQHHSALPRGGRKDFVKKVILGRFQSDDGHVTWGQGFSRFVDVDSGDMKVAKLAFDFQALLTNEFCVGS